MNRLTPSEAERVRGWVDWTFLGTCYCFVGIVLLTGDFRALVLAGSAGMGLLTFEASLRWLLR